MRRDQSRHQQTARLGDIKGMCSCMLAHVANACVEQQRRKMFLSRGAGLENMRNVCAKRISAGFSPHLLGGSGGMLPREI